VKHNERSDQLLLERMMKVANDSTSKIVLDLLQRLKEFINYNRDRITVAKFGVDDKGSNGTDSLRIEISLRLDTSKLTNVTVTGFGEK